MQIYNLVWWIRTWRRLLGGSGWWPWCWCLCSRGLAWSLPLGLNPEPCLWLSLTPITESCYWEPKSWVPRDPRGICRQDSRRKHALLTSGMVSGWCSKPVSGAGTVPCGAWVLSLWWLSGVVWDESPSLVQQMQFNFAFLLSHCYVSKIGEILPLFCPLNWRQTCL